MVWLVLNGNGKSTMVLPARIPLDGPAPAVMAEGVGGVSCRGWQYWLEADDGLPVPFPPAEVAARASPATVGS
jgi:hypothetical protein